MSERARQRAPLHLAHRAWLPALKRVGVGAVMLAVVILLVWQARSIDWTAVAQAVRQLPASTLGGAAALAATGYVVYGSFDLFGRHQIGPVLKPRTMMGVAMVSYAFSLNLGTLVGGLGFRYRLYARRGLGAGQTLHVVGVSILTNWLSYPLLLGLALLAGLAPLPPPWQGPAPLMSAVGVALCALPLLYLAACACWPRRRWLLRGHAVVLPQWPFALLQLTMSTLNWLCNAGVIYLLMPAQVSFWPVLACLLLSATAGLITHIPGGVGVTEAVFLTLLDGVAPHDAVLGALLAYRGVYYLAPLAVAVLAYLDMEAASRARRVGAQDPAR